MRFPALRNPSADRMRRLRRNPWVRYGVAGCILLAVLAYHMVPTIVTEGAMRQAMRDAFTQWLGAPASISGSAEITYWPHAQVTVHGVAIPRPGGGGQLVYGNAATLTADFGIVGALLGTPHFSDLKLDNAVIVLEDGGAAGDAPANRLSMAVTAIQNGRSEAAQGKGPGQLQLAGSTIAIAGDDDTWVAKAVNGKLDWEKINGTARFSGSAEIAGVPTTVSISATRPAALFAGGSSNVDLSLTNATGTVRYEGSASSKKPYFLDGSFSLSTSDLQELMRSLGIETHLLNTAGQASLKGQVARSGDSLRFSPVELSIGGVNGSGVLDIVPQTENGPSRVSATMAFTDIALSDAQSSLPSWIDSVAEGSGENDTALSDLDLRFSAGTVRLSDLSLSDVAASIIRTSEQTSFDIADSRLDNGSLFAHVAIRRNGTADVRLNAENVRSGPLFRQLGVAVPLESDALGLELNYKAALPLEETSKEGLSGSFRFSAGRGQLKWLDLNAILATARNSNAFAFSPLKQSPYLFQSIAGHGTLDGATLRLGGVTIEGENEQVTIEGRLDTASGRDSAPS